jgi:hypothetical protein
MIVSQWLAKQTVPIVFIFLSLSVVGCHSGDNATSTQNDTRPGKDIRQDTERSEVKKPRDSDVRRGDTKPETRQGNSDIEETISDEETTSPEPVHFQRATVKDQKEIKTVHLDWETTGESEYYRIELKKDNNSAFKAFDTNADGKINEEDRLSSQTTEVNVAVPIPQVEYKRAAFRVVAFKSQDKVAARSKSIRISAISLGDLIGYVKASNTDKGDEFGDAVDFARGGDIMAVGAPVEGSSSTEIGGDQTDNGAEGAGAVYVFVKGEKGWSQQAYLKASNAEEGDGFGGNVALSDDGSTLAVGAVYEKSSATGVGGEQGDNEAIVSGAVYVFVRKDGDWSQQAYVKASNTESFDNFGASLALSNSGDTLSVGAPGEDSREDGVHEGIDNGQQDNNTKKNAGAVYVFKRNGGAWAQQAYIKTIGSPTGEKDYFGDAVSLSAKGDTLAVGGDDRIDYVDLYKRSDGEWSTRETLRPSRDEGHDGQFGSTLALSSGGNTVVIGAPTKHTPDTPDWSGAIYVFEKGSRNLWSETAFFKASNAEEEDYFGSTLALSNEGDTLAVRSSGDSEVYTFRRTTDGNWSEQSLFKARAYNAEFGSSLELSGDGEKLLIGAPGEDSDATGVSGEQNNNAEDAGAVYVY